MDEFDFGSLEIIEIPVTGPDGKKYILREASGDSVARYNNARAKCLRFQDGGISSVEGQGYLDLLLLTLTLCRAKEDGSADLSKYISKTTLQGWPNRALKKLAVKAQEISEIDDNDDLDTLKKMRDKLNERIERLEGSAKNGLESTEIGLDWPNNGG